MICKITGFIGRFIEDDINNENMGNKIHFLKGCLLRLFLVGKCGYVVSN